MSLPEGYETVLGESGVDLSGGQRQRLALARALLLEPPILILDDPTASVDPKTEHEIVSALRRAMAGRTTFVVANRLSLLRRADVILVLSKGHLLQVGTHDNLVQLPGPYRDAALLQLMDVALAQHRDTVSATDLQHEQSVARAPLVDAQPAR
jgi:ATP-binding cassette subfamily B protein